MVGSNFYSGPEIRFFDYLISWSYLDLLHQPLKDEAAPFCRFFSPPNYFEGCLYNTVSVKPMSKGRVGPTFVPKALQYNIHDIMRAWLQLRRW